VSSYLETRLLRIGPLTAEHVSVGIVELPLGETENRSTGHTHTHIPTENNTQLPLGERGWGELYVENEVVTG